MRSKAIENKKDKLKLSRMQRDVLVGLLLGDGHLETQNKGRTYRLKVEHSIKQNEYVDWLYEIFEDWCEMSPKVKKREGVASSYYFTTYSHGLFRFYGQQFYPEGKKAVPKMIKKLISSISLAVWFMDDGSLKSKQHKTYVIHTLGYTKQELEVLQTVLKEKFNLITTLHNQKKKYWRIYIPSHAAQLFYEIVCPYIISSMKYKLGNIMPKK